MNKIVVEHYPAERLPQDLRSAIGEASSVTVTVETEPPEQDFQAFLANLRSDIAERRDGVTIEDATARVRALRDEWDD